MSATKFRKMTRREFIELLAIAGGASMITACGGPSAAEQATLEVLPTVAEPTMAPVEMPTAAPQAGETQTPTPQPTEDTEKKKYGGTLHMLAGDIPSLDGPACGYFDWWLSNKAIYDRLFDLDTQAQPMISMAEDWPEVSEDGLVYRVRVKKGITFHNGRELKAEDIKFSIDRNLSASLNGVTCGLDYLKKIEGANEVLLLEKPPDFVDLPGTKVLDDYTVEVRLVEPYVIFPLVFIDNTFCIVPKQEVLEAGADWGTKVVIGSGPFKLAEWVAGEHVYLEPYKNYWRKGLPYVDRVEVYLNLDAQAAILQFENRELDFIKDIDPETAKRYLKDPVFKNDVYYVPTPWVNYIELALNTKPFDDPRMRHAFAMAIDKEAVTMRTAGASVPWDTFITPTMREYDPNWQYKLRYNPEEAARIVKELYPNGVKVQFWTWDEFTAQIIQADLAKVGIELEILTKEFGVVMNDLKSGAIQAAWRGWWYPLPDVQSFPTVASICDPNDQTRWPSYGPCDEIQNQYVAEMSKLSLNDPKRVEVIRKLMDYLMNEKAHQIVVQLNKGLDLYAQYVKGMVPNPYIGFPELAAAWIDRELYEKIKDIKPQS